MHADIPHQTGGNDTSIQLEDYESNTIIDHPKTNKAGDKKEIELASEKEIDGKRYSKANQKDGDLPIST